jgi:hypothetical protein
MIHELKETKMQSRLDIILETVDMILETRAKYARAGKIKMAAHARPEFHHLRRIMVTQGDTMSLPEKKKILTRIAELGSDIGLEPRPKGLKLTTKARKDFADVLRDYRNRGEKGLAQSYMDDFARIGGDPEAGIVVRDTRTGLRKNKK